MSDKDVFLLGCEHLGVDLSERQVTQFSQLLSLLQKWNRVHNLTALKRLDDIICKHFLDSLSINPHIRSEAHILDVGTGAGFPGLPLAILNPEQRWVLLDSNHKKTSFIRMVVSQCQLENIEVLTQRVEAFPKASSAENSITAITTRAFADPLKALDLFAGIISENQRIYLMLGKAIPEQCEHSKFALSSIEPVSVPFLEGERHLATLVRNAF